MLRGVSRRIREAAGSSLRNSVSSGAEAGSSSSSSSSIRASSSSSASTSSPSAAPTGQSSPKGQPQLKDGAKTKKATEPQSSSSPALPETEQRKVERLQRLQKQGGIRLQEGGPIYTKESAWDYFKDSPFIGAMSLVNPPSPDRIRKLAILERTGTVWMYLRKGSGYAVVVLAAVWLAIYTPFFSSTQKLIRQIKNASDIALVNLNLSRFEWMGSFDIYAVRIVQENGITALLTRVKPNQHPSTRILALRALSSLARSNVGLEDLRADPSVFETVNRILSDPAYRGFSKYEGTEKYVRIPYDPEEAERDIILEAERFMKLLDDPRRNPQNEKQRLQAIPIVGWLYKPAAITSAY